MDAWTSGLFFGAMVEEELDADLLEDLEADEELEEDLDEEREVDEDENNACAPYLARQMSCLGSRTPGVKDTPFLGLVWGVKEFTQVQAARRLTTLLLHVWIEWYIMV